jgi:hypothetical protein
MPMIPNYDTILGRGLADPHTAQYRADWVTIINARMALKPASFDKVVYISDAGSDGKSGADAANAVLTISKAMSLIAGFQNVAIYFREGGVWQDTSSSGTSIMNIVGHGSVLIAAYPDATNANRGRRPRITRFGNAGMVWNKSGAWALAANGRYTMDTTGLAATIGAVRYSVNPEASFVRCTTTAQVEDARWPNAFYHDQVGHTLHCKVNGGSVSPSTFNLEACDLNTSIAIEPVNNSLTWVEGIHLDGNGYNTSTQYGFKPQVDVGQAVVVVGCVFTYGGYHLMPVLAGPSGAAGVGLYYGCYCSHALAGTTGTAGVLYASLGGGEAVWMNCVMGAGHHPEASWYDPSVTPRHSSCTAFYAHVAQDLSAALTGVTGTFGASEALTFSGIDAENNSGYVQTSWNAGTGVLQAFIQNGKADAFPAVGSVVTGGTSGATGTVSAITVYSHKLFAAIDCEQINVDGGSTAPGMAAGVGLPTNIADARAHIVGYRMLGRQAWGALNLGANACVVVGSEFDLGSLISGMSANNSCCRGWVTRCSVAGPLGAMWNSGSSGPHWPHLDHCTLVHRADLNAAPGVSSTAIVYPLSTSQSSGAKDTAFFTNCVFSVAHNAYSDSFGTLFAVGTRNTPVYLNGNTYVCVPTRTGAKGYDADLNKIEILASVPYRGTLGAWAGEAVAMPVPSEVDVNSREVRGAAHRGAFESPSVLGMRAQLTADMAQVAADLAGQTSGIVDITVLGQHCSGTAVTISARDAAVASGKHAPIFLSSRR